MSLISIAQRETFHISFVQSAKKDYEQTVGRLDRNRNT